MTGYRVAIFGQIEESGRRALEADARFSLACLPDHAAGRFEAAADADAIIVRMTPIDTDLIEAAPRLRFVARHGVGHDTVDKAALTARGIPLAITGDVNSGAVAEHALALMLAAAKRVIDYDQAVKAGDFAIRDSFSAGELHGKTALLVGFGRIGRKVAALARACGMDVLVFDPFLETTPEGVTSVSRLEDGLAAADYVSLHAPKTAWTTHLIDSEALARMKPGATLVNVARGGLVDEAALREALLSGRLRAAALDVFENEPPAANDPVLSTPVLIATPHSAAFTSECATRMSMACARNVIDFFDGRLDPDLVVNKDALANAGASGGAA